MISLTRSLSESSAYELEFYRGRADSVEELEELLELLEAQKVDVCRLKVNANDKRVFSFLTNLGVPYQLYNMLYTNHVSINELPDASFVWSADYDYELYTPSHADRMRKLVLETIDRKTWVNYDSDLVCDKITDQRELISAQNFACSFYAQNGSKASWIMKYRNEDVGFFMGEEVEDGFYGTFFGIHPDYRNMNHSKVAYQMMMYLFKQCGYRYFKNDIGIMNIPSQKTATGQLMVPTDIYFHFELYPFLSARTDATVSLKQTQFGEVDKEVRDYWSSELEGKSLIALSGRAVDQNQEVTSIIAELAVNNAKCSLIVLREFNQNDDLINIKYLKYR